MARRTRDRAAIYARFSSHNQRDESIEIQLDNCRAYCEEHGLDVVQEYCDHAQTGRDTNRAGFQRMLLDADRHLFDYVVIYKVTRIMRNRDEMAVLRIRLHKAGVEILYAGEQIAGGSSGVLQLGMLEVLAEWESAILSERVKDGIRKNAEMCLANGQRMFGWDVGEDGRYVVNEVEAGALRLAREIVMGGGSVADAVRALEPYRSKNGKRIGQQALTNMLRRPQNWGCYTYAGVVVEGGMPALWTREEQERLEGRMGGTKARRGEDMEWYPLTGRMYHVHEDGTTSAMRGWAGTSHTGRRYHYYQCRACRRTLRKEGVEREVADAVLRELRDPESRERIADLMLDEEAWEQDGPTQVEIIEGELREVEKSFERIWQAIEAGIAPPGGKERTDALKERQALLERELREAKALACLKLDRDAVMFWLECASEMEPDELIATFVSRVYAHEDGRLEVICLFDESEPPGPSGPDDGGGEFAQNQAMSTTNP
ncbi:MAG: recombinase family protein [Atopobiaceae bacterium]|nr:recombinase family protein [Atopobiaceae bacterium]MBR3384943.1 recombinase family protein [Atopobiaceae bacterium]